MTRVRREAKGGPSPASKLPADLVPGAGHTSWAYQTRRFQVLDFDFAVRTTDLALGRYLDEAFDGAVAPGEPTVIYSIVSGLKGKYPHLVFSGEARLMSASWPHVVPRVVTWDVNRKAIDSVQDSHVVLHAGAVAWGDRGLLLPAEMEAGKTTLVAGLLRTGFDYLTDEAAAINPKSFAVAPFAKPLSLDAGSWALFPGMRPTLQGDAEEYASEQWLVSPNLLRSDSVSSGVPVRYVVFPTYVSGAKTQLRPIRASAALIRMMQQTFGFRHRPERNVRTLGHLVERTEQYELTVGDLGRACDIISQLCGPSRTDEHRDVGD